MNNLSLLSSILTKVFINHNRKSTLYFNYKDINSFIYNNGKSFNQS